MVFFNIQLWKDCFPGKESIFSLDKLMFSWQKSWQYFWFLSRSPSVLSLSHFLPPLPKPSLLSWSSPQQDLGLGDQDMKCNPEITRGHITQHSKWPSCLAFFGLGPSWPPTDCLLNCPREGFFSSTPILSWRIMVEIRSSTYLQVKITCLPGEHQLAQEAGTR